MNRPKEGSTSVDGHLLPLPWRIAPLFVVVLAAIAVYLGRPFASSLTDILAALGMAIFLTMVVAVTTTFVSRIHVSLSNGGVGISAHFHHEFIPWSGLKTATKGSRPHIAMVEFQAGSTERSCIVTSLQLQAILNDPRCPHLDVSLRQS